MVQTYNEFKVDRDFKGKIVNKKATERKTVRIDEQTAKSMNEQNGLYYELAKKQPETKK